MNKIAFPDSTIATFEIPVRITDINYGNHLGNDALVSILHEARMQWLSRHGYTELNIERTGLIMAALQIEYKAESFYGDVLLVELAVGAVSQIKFDLFYRISVSRDSAHKLIALAQTIMVSYDYSTSKKIAIPAGLAQLLQPGIN